MSVARRDIVRRTVIWAVSAGFLGWLIYFHDLRLGDLGSFLPMSDQLARSNMDIILIPLLASITIFYVASIVTITLEGVLAEVLT